VSNLLKGLNPDQQLAVTHQGTPLLVLAGAGSGKTRVLTHRAAFLVEQKISRSSEILLLTFTNKAAAEMKERMSHLLSDNVNNLFAGTFHSFSCRLLRIYGQEIGISSDFVIYDADDSENLIRSILAATRYTPKEFKPSSLMYYIENCKNNFISPTVASSNASGFWDSTAARIYQLYQQALDRNQAVDFSDLIFKAVSLLTEKPQLKQKINETYQHILVDEYQDTNQTQYLLTKLLAGDRRQITAVGDASQSIYGWRGADYKNLTAFTTDFSDAKVINLEENYRSTQIILDAANSVIAQNRNHPVLKLFTKRTSVEPIHLYQAASEVDEAEYLSQKINFLKQIGINYSDIAVLYRMNTQSRVIEESFLKNQIPYVLIGGLRFYDRAEVKDVLAMLRYIQNPKDELSLGRLNKALGKRRTENFIASLDHISRKNNSLVILQTALDLSLYLQKFDVSSEDDSRRLENIEELKSVAATFPKLTDFLENVALVQSEYSQQEKRNKNKDKNKKSGVKLMTIHSSKGLEFPVVFLVGFEEGILPHSRSIVDESQLEEERRLCYVGITRAKDHLYITYASRRLQFGRSSFGQASRFLSDIPEISIKVDTFSSVRLNPDSDTGTYYDPDIF
jgi:DNA helicase-2/ATP-dependent DNA helicase PcrA